MILKYLFKTCVKNMPVHFSRKAIKPNVRSEVYDTKTLNKARIQNSCFK